jgi:hypothetical protein
VGGKGGANAGALSSMLVSNSMLLLLLLPA